MKKILRQTTQKGFTVIELIVVISIFGIITGVLLFNYRDFQKSTDYKLFIQEVALALKSQQQASMSGVIKIDPQERLYPTADWRPSYGMFFEANTNKITVFYDYNQNGTYENYGQPCKTMITECLEEMYFTDDRITGLICGGAYTTPDYYQDGQIQCTNQYGQVSVLFKRPFPDAIFRANYNPANYVAGNPAGIPILDTVEIPIQSVSGGSTQVITINPVGAISTRTLAN